MTKAVALSYRRLELLPRGSVLSNTARGAMVGEQDLARALQEGLLSGAALDLVDTGSLDVSQTEALERQLHRLAPYLTRA